MTRFAIERAIFQQRCVLHAHKCGTRSAAAAFGVSQRSVRRWVAVDRSATQASQARGAPKRRSVEQSVSP